MPATASKRPSFAPGMSSVERQLIVILTEAANRLTSPGARERMLWHLRLGDITAAIAELPWPSFNAILNRAEKALISGMTFGGLQEYGDFDPLAYRSIAAARAQAARLVVNVNSTVRKAIRDTMVDGMVKGQLPNQIADRLRHIVGLDPRFARAVTNFRDGLIRKGASPQFTAKATNRYYRRLHTHRARRIARTELAFAANTGRQQAWTQAIDNGILPPTVKKKWLTGPNPCPKCAAMSGKSTDMEGEFVLKGLVLPSPPLHPSCGCVLVLDLGYDYGDITELRGWSEDAAGEEVAKHLTENHGPLDQWKHGRRGNNADLPRLNQHYRLMETLTGGNAGGRPDGLDRYYDQQLREAESAYAASRFKEVSLDNKSGLALLDELEVKMGMRREPEKVHPERYSPNKGYGVHLKHGEIETHTEIGPNNEPIEYDVTVISPAEYWANEDRYQLVSSMAASGFKVRVPNSQRPIPYVFRTMSEAEWQAALLHGYIQSDHRMNLGDEGTVTADRNTGTFYMVPGQNRIVRIKTRPEEKWWMDPSDYYIKTPEQIPIEQVDLVSPVLEYGGDGRTLSLVVKHLTPDHGPLDQWKHGRRKGRRSRLTVDDWMRRHPDGNPEVFHAADSYLSTHAPDRHLQILDERYLTDSQGREIADWYDATDSDPDNPSTREAYAAFNDEVSLQHRHLLDAGYKFEPWEKPGQPYADSKQMRADVRNNRHLYYFKTSEGTTPNALLSPEQNDKFRSVHDIFGHALGGNSFGPKGETNAFMDHSQMFSKTARKAMATETLAQNAWFNFSRHNEGRPVRERDFAEQKATLLDPDLYWFLYEGADIEKSEDTRKREDADTGKREGTREDPDDEDWYGSCPSHREDTRVIKHLGPGPHPSGSPQLVHGVKGKWKGLLDDLFSGRKTIATVGRYRMTSGDFTNFYRWTGIDVPQDWRNATYPQVRHLLTPEFNDRFERWYWGQNASQQAKLKDLVNKPDPGTFDMGSAHAIRDYFSKISFTPPKLDERQEAALQWYRDMKKTNWSRANDPENLFAISSGDKTFIEWLADRRDRDLESEKAALWLKDNPDALNTYEAFVFWKNRIYPGNEDVLLIAMYRDRDNMTSRDWKEANDNLRWLDRQPGQGTIVNSFSGIRNDYRSFLTELSVHRYENDPGDDNLDWWDSLDNPQREYVKSQKIVHPFLSSFAAFLTQFRASPLLMESLPPRADPEDIRGWIKNERWNKLKVRRRTANDILEQMHHDPALQKWVDDYLDELTASSDEEDFAASQWWNELTHDERIAHGMFEAGETPNEVGEHILSEFRASPAYAEWKKQDEKDQRNALLNLWDSATANYRNDVTLEDATLPADPREAVINIWVNQVDNAWVGSAYDDAPESIALQWAIAENFNTPRDRFNLHNDSVMDGRRMYEKNKPFYDAWAGNVYFRTQTELEAAGFDSVEVYRGMNWTGYGNDQPPDYLTLAKLYGENGMIGEFPTNPGSSWSAQPDTAAFFGTNGAMFATRLDRRNIFATSLTGLGAFNESELIGMFPAPARARVWTYQDWRDMKARWQMGSGNGNWPGPYPRGIFETGDEYLHPPGWYLWSDAEKAKWYYWNRKGIEWWPGHEISLADNKGYSITERPLGWQQANESWFEETLDEPTQKAIRDDWEKQRTGPGQMSWEEFLETERTYRVAYDTRSINTMTKVNSYWSQDDMKPLEDLFTQRTGETRESDPDAWSQFLFNLWLGQVGMYG